MTRLFPRPLEEHFPKSSRDGPWLSTNFAVAAPVYAGGVGISFSPLALLHRRAATLPIKAAAYCCPVFLVLGATCERICRKWVDTYLEEIYIESPKRRIYDRADKFGFDDVEMLSAVAGLVLAARRKVLPGIAGWRRWVGFASLGAGAGEVTYGCYWTFRNQEFLRKRREERDATKAEREDGIQEILSAVKRTFFDQKACQVQQAASEEPEEYRAVPNGLARNQSNPVSTLEELSPPSLDSRSPPRFNETDGPHVTGPEPGESELKPVPATNYDWPVSGERVVPELEAHITSLRTHRRKLSEQATLLWHWLAEKEGEYYRIRDDPNTIGYDAEQAKIKAREYCKVLSFEHLALWMAVGKIDWMIADSQKRIAQHQAQSTHSSSEQGTTYVTWLPNSAPPTLREPPEFVLWRLRKQQQDLETMLQVIDKTSDGLEHDIDDPKMPNMPPQIRMALSKHPNRRQEVQRLYREGQEQKAKALAMKEAVEEVVRDGEAKAGQGDEAAE